MRLHHALWLLAALAAGAAETGTVLRPTELRAKPFADAAKIADLPASAAVEIVSRQGAWMQVKAAGQQGWVKLLAVRTGGGSSGSGNASGVLSAVSLFKTGSSGTTVATGVKGLDEESLRNAQPNPAQLAKLGSYAVSAGEAGRFARAGKLNAVSVDYLPAGAPAADPSGSGRTDR